jgi:hypothetical protein
MAEYARLFDHALVARERKAAGLTWRFRGRAGVEAWVRDLADREAACCAFLTHTVSGPIDDEVTWHVATNGGPEAEVILDEFYRLPETVASGPAGLLERLTDAGLNVATSGDGNITSVS